MVKKKKKIKISDLIMTIFLILIISINLFISKDKIIRFLNDTFYNKPITMNLTESQKIEDFNYLYKTITTSSPKCSLEEYKKLYGISFVDNYDKYLELVTNTKNDFEFFCVMKSIITDLPSFHTDIVFPRYSTYETLDCYNSENVLNTKYIKPQAEYWESILANECVDYDLINNNSTRFDYIDGIYINDESCLLTTINNMDVNTFILQQLSTIPYFYDYLNNQPYKESFVIHENPFSDTSQKIEYTIKNTDGYYSNHIGYVDILSEWIFRYGHNFNPTNDYIPSVTDKWVYSFDDNDNGICYIMLDTMLGNCSDLPDIIESSPNDTIILDIRYNSGGYVYGVKEYVYPPLFSDDMIQNKEWYIPINSKTKQILWGQKFVLGTSSNSYKKYKNTNTLLDTFGDEYIYAKKSIEFKGNAESDKSVYLLISHKTGSAADGFASLIKGKDSVKLIGKNTGGEGLMGSFIADSLPNSRLVFIFMPSVAFGKDGLNDAVYGTSPDVYVNASVKGAITNMEMIKNGQDPYTYENRLKWDNVLIKTLEIIEENKK